MAPRVRSSERTYEGSILSVRVDAVELSGGDSVTREVVEHDDAVAVVAIDVQERVLLIEQYRHPAGKRLWELPAGLRDEPDESPLDTARRELAEEVGLRAAEWTTLVDLRPSPGMSTEIVRIYQAGGLSERVAEGAEAEEREIRLRWVALPDAVREVLDGSITNGLAVAGILAAAVRRGVTDDHTRPADAEWPSRP